MTEAKKPAGKPAAAKSPRRRSREFALQGLYQWRIGGQDEAAIEGLYQDLEALFSWLSDRTVGMTLAEFYQHKKK